MGGIPSPGVFADVLGERSLLGRIPRPYLGVGVFGALILVSGSIFKGFKRSLEVLNVFEILRP